MEVQDRQHHALEILPAGLGPQRLDVLEDGRDDLAARRAQRHAVAEILRQQLADIEQCVDRAGALAQPLRPHRLRMLEERAATRQPGADRRIGLVERLRAAGRRLQDEQHGERDGRDEVQALHATSMTPEANNSTEMARRKPISLTLPNRKRPSVEPASKAGRTNGRCGSAAAGAPGAFRNRKTSARLCMAAMKGWTTARCATLGMACASHQMAITAPGMAVTPPTRPPAKPIAVWPTGRTFIASRADCGRSTA